MRVQDSTSKVEKLRGSGFEFQVHEGPTFEVKKFRVPGSRKPKIFTHLLATECWLLTTFFATAQRSPQFPLGDQNTFARHDAGPRRLLR